MTNEAAAIDLGVSVRSVQNMLKPLAVKRLLSYQGDPSRTRIRGGKYDSIEKDLVTWIDQV